MTDEGPDLEALWDLPEASEPLPRRPRGRTYRAAHRIGCVLVFLVIAAVVGAIIWIVVGVAA
jgi:hypothetical protein